MIRAWILLPMVAFVLAGCRTEMNTNVVTQSVGLPGGERITVKQENRERIKGKKPPVIANVGPDAVWTRPGQPDKQLTILTPTTRLAEQPPVNTDDFQTARVERTADGNRVWLVQRNQVIASFDYVQGIAILGPQGQPDWARP